MIYFNIWHAINFEFKSYNKTLCWILNSSLYVFLSDMILLYSILSIIFALQSIRGTFNNSIKAHIYVIDMYPGCFALVLVTKTHALQAVQHSPKYRPQLLLLTPASSYSCFCSWAAPPAPSSWWPPWNDAPKCQIEPVCSLMSCLIFLSFHIFFSLYSYYFISYFPCILIILYLLFLVFLVCHVFI